MLEKVTKEVGISSRMPCEQPESTLTAPRQSYPAEYQLGQGEGEESGSNVSTTILSRVGGQS